MKFKKIYIDDFSIINKFLTENFSSPTHWPDWNLIVAEQFKTSFFYFGAFEGSKLIGIYPVHEEKVSSIGLKKQHSGHFKLIPNGGWLFSKKTLINLSEIPQNWNTLVSFYSLPVIPEFNVVYNSKKITVRSTLLVDLNREVENIWSESINSKRRNKIRKAQATNITIKYAKSDQDIKSFFDLYKSATERLKMNHLPIKVFFDLINKAKNIKLELLMAFSGETQVANMAIVYDKNFCIYWLGNTAIDVPNNGQGELLQWEAIKIAKEVGCRYYDLCFIDEVKLPHIYSFKSDFSKQTEKVASYRHSSFFYKVVKKLTHA